MHGLNHVRPRDGLERFENYFGVLGMGHGYLFEVRNLSMKYVKKMAPICFLSLQVNIQSSDRHRARLEAASEPVAQLPNEHVRIIICSGRMYADKIMTIFVDI